MRPICTDPYAVDRPPNFDLALGRSAAAPSSGTGQAILIRTSCTASLPIRAAADVSGGEEDSAYGVRAMTAKLVPYR
jgi:hypothetical protein